MTDTHSAAFEYVELQDPATEIRLLRLLRPASFEPNKIRCELTTWRIGQEPAYTAVSYTWGAPGNVTSIYINDKTFTVRSNCWYVLQQARDNGIAGYLWIDAICINQCHAVEKSAQVALMGDIYRQAVRTNMTIGPHCDDSEHLLDAIGEHVQWARRLVEEAYTLGKLQTGLLQLKDHEQRSMEHNSQTTLQNLSMWPRWVSYELNLSSAFTNYSASQLKRLWKAIDALFRRPYFERLWIVQEVVLSRTAIVLCGNSSTTFDTIKEFESNLYRHSEDTKVWSRERIEYNSHETLEAIFDFARKYKDAVQIGFDLNELTDRMSSFKCSDPRDRIFGVLSLVDWHGKTPILPDYTKSKLDVALQTMGHISGIATNDAERRALADGSLEATETSATWPIISATQLAVSLGLTSDDNGIKDLLTQRRSSGYGANIPRPSIEPHKEGSRIKVPADYSSRLHLDTITGELKCCLRRRDDSHLAINPRQLELLQARDLVRDASVQDPSLLTITTAGQLCARLPTDARERDIILSFQRTSAFDVGLLVRDVGDDGGRFQIIGQVIFEDGTELCPGGGGCVCGLPAEQHAIDQNDMVAWFDSLDLLLFVCQTLVRGERVPDEGCEMFENWNGVSDVPLEERDGRMQMEEVYEDLEDEGLRLGTRVTGVGNGWTSWVEVVRKEEAAA